MAENTGVEDGSLQPKEENETIALANTDPAPNANNQDASLNSFEELGVTPDTSSEPKDLEPNQDEETPPVRSQPPDTTPLVIVTGEGNGSTSGGTDTLTGSDPSEASSDIYKHANSQEEDSNVSSSQVRSENGERARQQSGSTEGSRGDGPPTRSRAQPILDASKRREKDNRQQHYRSQQLDTRQKRIQEIRHKETDHRAEILERKKRQEEEELARKEAIVRRSRERSDNAREKRRSWSAFGSRDYSSPVPSSGTPLSARGRSTDRMSDRQTTYSGVLPLGTSKRLSSSVSALHKPVHLVRLGPNENDWFEVHLPEPLPRRGSSPGNNKKNDSSPLPASSSATPRHHMSSPNLASPYPHRDSRSAHSTPTHMSRPLSATKRSSSNSKLNNGAEEGNTPATGTTPAPAKRAPSPRTPLHMRPPSPRQQPPTPRTAPLRVPSPRTVGGQGSTTVDGSKTTPGRAASPRNLPKHTNGDRRKPSEGKKTPGQAPPIKKALTPRTDIVKSTVSSPTRTTTTPKTTTARTSTTPKGLPKQAKPAAVKAAAPEKTVKTAAPDKTVKTAAPEKTVKTAAPEKTPAKTETVEKEKTETKEPQRALSPTVSESSSGSAPSSVGSAKAQPQAQPQAQAQATAQPQTQPAKDLTDEERAKQALAERRRQAREKAEREAELERQRQEQLKREEEERIRLEEEERIRMEEEARRLAEEHKKAEEERLRKAIEDNERMEKEEEERKAAEEAEALQRAEEEKIRQEELRKQEEELAEKCRKENEERDARKKRVEEIMKKARRGAQAKDKDDASEDGDSGSESGSGSGSERKTNGVNSTLPSSSSLLNNEKYRNLLFNRNKSTLSGEEDEEGFDGDQLEGATNGKAATSFSDSDDGNMSVEGLEAVESLQDKEKLYDDKDALTDDGQGGDGGQADDERGSSDDKEEMREDVVPDIQQELNTDWSDLKDVSNGEAVLATGYEEQVDSLEGLPDSLDGDAVADMGVAEEGGDPSVPPTNGNVEVENNSADDDYDEKSEGSSGNGNEVELLGTIKSPVINVPATSDFNNANGESFIQQDQDEDLITKKALLDLDDTTGSHEDGGTIEELSPDSACDKLNANLGMKAGFSSDDTQMTLSFSPLGELESNGEQQQPMAVCMTPEDAV